ncbi:polymorphic toxin-type HINT domain-containing protein [Micromonospora sp. NPDC003197]
MSRPLPATAVPNEALPDEKRMPVVPLGVAAGGGARKLSAAEWAGVPKSGATRTVAAADEVFTDALLRPGFVIGDTSLVAYFNLRDETPAWSSWRATLYEAESGTEQASTTLTRADLDRAACSAQREYCRSFGGGDGWTVDPAKNYFITFTALLDDGGEVVSAPSDQARPRVTIDPPEIANPQAAGCGCGNALALTGAGPANRAIGVNTSTGAFSRVEPDLGMSSYGVPFSSVRTYSSANPSPGGFGPGWAWSYEMRVTVNEQGAVVRAEDGAEGQYRLVDGAYQRPAGVRSTLRRAGEGWELVTPTQITYRFDAQGRLASITNARGKGVTLAYTDFGVTLTDASGRTAVAKIESGLIREISLPDHRRVRFSYENGALTAAQDARGYVWHYRYGPTGQLIEVVNPKRVVEVHNEYADTGRVVKQRDALGKETTFAWDAAAQEATTTDADGVVIRDGYRRNVLVYSQRGNRDSDNHRYDASLNRTLVVNGKHNQHEAGYDPAGNRTSQTAPQSLNFTEVTKYDSRNNPIEYVDGEGNRWRDTYNEFNELVKSEDAEGNTITYRYDDRGLLVESTDQRGKVTRYENLPDGDPNAGLPKAVVSPEGRRAEVRYDRVGRTVAAIDPRGTVAGADRDDYTTRYTFDAQDRTVAVRQPGKHGSWRTEYDELGRTSRTTTPTGIKTEYRYFDNSLLRTVNDPRRTISYRYTDAGRRAASTVEMKHGPDQVTTYAYNGKGLLQKVTSPRGNLPGANPADFTTTYIYDANDNPIRVDRPYPGGQVVSRDIGVDDLDRTVSKTDEFNKTSQFERDNTGNVRSTTDNLGRKSQLEYDRNGRQTGINDPGGSVTKFTYDEAGNKTKAVSATGGVTTWEYDDDGLLVSSTEPRGNVEGADRERFTTHYEYDAAGNTVKVTDPLDHVTGYRYDANNRLTSVTDAKKRSTYYTYREDDLIRTVHTPDSPYDPRHPEQRSTVYDYFGDGLLASVRDPEGHRNWLAYDEAGRLVKQTDPLGRRVEIGYDVENNVVSAITVREHEKLTREQRAKRTIVDSYDIVGRRDKRTLGSEGPVYTWGYDAKDRTTSYGDPLGVRKVTYDDEDQISEVVRTEAGGDIEKFDYGYDVRGNITNRSYPDGTRVTTAYDADSRITALTAAGGAVGPNPATWQFGYDVAGRRTSTTLPAVTGLVERRGYDDAGRLTSIGTERIAESPQGKAPGGTRARGGDDVPGAPTQVTAQPGAGLAVVSWEPPKEHGRSDIGGYVVTASPGGRTVTVDAPASTAVVNGLDAGTSYTFTVAAYDKKGSGPVSAASEPVVPVAVPQDPVSSYQLDLDEVGNPTRVVTTRAGVSESVAYSYDKVDRLTSACYGVASCGERTKPVGRIDYSYDLVGNRTSQKRSGSAGNDVTTYFYDDADQLTKEVMKEPRHVTTKEYDYDLNGNQVRSGTDRLAYHLDNSLAKATVAGQDTTYAYDAAGLRLTGTTSAEGDTFTQRWTWDVNGTLPQIAIDSVTNAAGQTVEQRGFTYGPDDEPLALLDPATGAHSYSHDWLGGVANMLSPAGTPEIGYDYDPFGNPRAGPTLQPGAPAESGGTGTQATAPENPLQFTGAYQDSSTGNGNYYLRARNYDPSTGRFSSTDPMAQGGAATSAYTYADNNPTSYTDPTGMAPAPDNGGTPAPATANTGPSPEELAKAQQIQSKSVLDVVLEAGGQILMEFLGINDIISCLNGDLGACVSMVIGALPWGKIFKAKKIAEAIFRAGKAVVTFFQEIKWARAIIQGAEKAAEAAKAAAAAAAKAAAEKAARAKAAAEAAAKKAAARAAAAAKAKAAKAKAATKKGSGKSDNPDKPNDGGSPSKCRNSFVAGTLVLLADGSRKPIESVEPGDAVLATDPESGRTEARQVSHTIRTDDDKEYVDLSVVDDDGGSDTITTTDHHRFWSVTRGDWVEAGQLKPGELLRTSAGTHVQLGAVRHYQANQVTYDLTVDDIHTYYVLAGDEPVLVHNCDDPGCPCTSLKQVANEAEDAGAQFASEYTSASGNVFRADNAEFVHLSPEFRAALPEVGHPSLMCSEVKCLAKAFEASGGDPESIRGGSMRTVHVGDLNGRHGSGARPCQGCQRLLRALGIRF